MTTELPPQCIRIVYHEHSGPDVFTADLRVKLLRCYEVGPRLIRCVIDGVVCSYVRNPDDETETLYQRVLP